MVVLGKLCVVFVELLEMLFLNQIFVYNLFCVIFVTIAPKVCHRSERKGTRSSIHRGLNYSLFKLPRNVGSSFCAHALPQLWNRRGAYRTCSLESYEWRNGSYETQSRYLLTSFSFKSIFILMLFFKVKIYLVFLHRLLSSSLGPIIMDVQQIK